MKKLLSLDSPIVQFMEHVADFFILNLLTVLCCIPVITVGAALTAHVKIMQNLTLGEEQPVVKAYFRAFKDNFKQATAVWLLAALLIAFYAVDIFVIYVYFDEGWAQMTYAFLAILGFVALGVLCNAFALIARYENTVKEHLRNGFILTFAYLPRTLLVVLLAALPLLMAIISIELFLNTLMIWLTFGISLVLFLQALIYKPILLNLDPKEEQMQEECLPDSQ